MSSGVGVNDACVQKFQELKLNHALRYIIFKMNATNTEIVLDKEAGKEATYDQFIQALPKDECRYAVFDFEYTEEGVTRNKILFVVWAPEGAKVKAKMLLAASKDSLRKKFVGIGVEIQATDLAEIDQKEVMDKVLRV